MARARARFTSRTLDNLGRAITRLPQVTLYDNSNFGEPYHLLAEFRHGQLHERTSGPIPGWARPFFASESG